MLITFYRLAQHAKKLHLVYNTEPDVLYGGEKSRFITQMEVENVHNIKHQIVSTHIPKAVSSLQRIEKDQQIISKIEAHFKDGISPSALLQYVRNPIDFYYRYILGIEEEIDVEELVRLKHFRDRSP